jgi:hypothetical protein
MVCSVVFFGLFYLYLWLIVKPGLIYDCATITNFPVFYKGWAFFRESMSVPGGFLNYLSALLSQLFYYPWGGGLVITAQAWAFCACTGWLFRAVALPAGRWLRFVPAMLILAAWARYAYHLPMMMGALASLFFACLYVAVPSGGGDASGATRPTRAAWVDPAVFVALSLISYVLSAAAFLPFAALCAIYELLYRRRYWFALVYLLFAAAFPYVAGVLLFRVSVVDAYTDMLPVSWRILGWPTRETMIGVVYALYLLPPAGVVLSRIAQYAYDMSHPARHDGHRAEGAVGMRSAKRVKPRPSRLGGWPAAPAVRWTGGSLFLLAGAGTVALVAPDHRQKEVLEVHHYACRRMWPEVLQAARRQSDNYFVMNAVNRALWHTGRLTRDIFSRVQHPDGLLLVGEDQILWHWHKFDTLIDLGLMNLAEKNLAECMEAFGEQPMILQRLATISMVKGRIDTARIYLGALSKTLFHDDWAKEYLARIESDPDLSGDPQIQHLRSQCIAKDSVALFFTKEPLLAALAGQRGGNRMAFEYLMASYLLNKQLDKVVQNVGRLREFGYGEIPPLYQEAILIYAYGTKKQVDLAGYAISPEVHRRIERFSSVFNRHNRNKDTAIAELAGEFRNSYFLYHIYGP